MCATRLSVFVRRLSVAGCAFFIIAALAACGSDAGSDAQADAPDVLVRVGNATLTASELQKAVPAGLAPDDSANYVKVYVKDWIDARLVSEVAAEEIDMTEIDRLTREYRDRLILLEYRRRLYAAQSDSISEDSIRAYYDAHVKEFRLERPLIKGTYLKVPGDASNLRTLRRLYASNDTADIDRLEKEVLKSAIHYDYFRDRWVDWEQVETRIPVDFGAAPDAWLARNRKLDTSEGSYTYLLYVSEYLPSGSPMPFDYARNLIVGRLLNAQRQAFDEMVSRQLYERALGSGKLKVYIQL